MIARFLFTAAHALFWAATDARDIRNGKDINHGVRWILRAAIEVGASLVFAFIRNEPIGIRLVLVTIAAAFLFSALFRFLLNTMRGRHWAYVSPSSWYDWQFMVFAWYQIGYRQKYRRFRKHEIERHKDYFRSWDKDYWEDEVAEYREHIHRAGTLAYIFEVVVFAILTFTASVA